MMRWLSSPFKRINAELEKHDLNNWYNHLAGILACMVGTAALPLMCISLLASFFGHVSIDPPSAVTPIYDAGFGFIFNRWFWRCMLACSFLAFWVFGRWHPEAQLEHKLGREAVRKYQAENGWPWR